MFFVNAGCRHDSDTSFIRNLMANCNTQVIRNLFYVMSHALDFDEGRSEGGLLTFRSGYCPELDRMRYTELDTYSEWAL